MSELHDMIRKSIGSETLVWIQPSETASTIWAITDKRVWSANYSNVRSFCPHEIPAPSLMENEDGTGRIHVAFGKAYDNAGHRIAFVMRDIGDAFEVYLHLTRLLSAR